MMLSGRGEAGYASLWIEVLRILKELQSMNLWNFEMYEPLNRSLFFFFLQMANKPLPSALCANTETHTNLQ